MESHTIIKRAEQFVKEQLEHDRSGHDWWHTNRVRHIALEIDKKEGADEFVCELASLLHDVADEKLNISKESGITKVNNWLHDNLLDSLVIQHVLNIISTMSYNGGHNPPMETIEGKIVQDADRLDAIGAIGIARTFAYAGWKGQLIHSPESSPRKHITVENYRNTDGTAIDHFYEKLFKLKDLMNTEWGKKLAIQRDQYMREYLNQFLKEWELTFRLC